MENTLGFLQKLSCFNGEVRHRIGTALKPLEERILACEEAERDLRRAFQRRNDAERILRDRQHQGEMEHNVWRQAELDERIALAGAEAQVWALVAQSNETNRLQHLWQEAFGTRNTWQASATRPILTNCFFSIVPAKDNSYRFFTITYP